MSLSPFDIPALGGSTLRVKVAIWPVMSIRVPDASVLLVPGAELGPVQTLLGREHTLCGQAFDHTQFRLEGVTERRVIQDAGQSLEVLAFNGLPPAEHMLLAWLPAQQVLFAADLNGSDGLPGSRLGQRLQHWLGQSGLRPRLFLTSDGDGRYRPLTGDSSS